MMLTTAELAAGNDSNLQTSEVLTCLADASWDKNLTDLTCTPSCAIPIYDTKILGHNWTDPTTVPQYNENLP